MLKLLTKTKDPEIKVEAHWAKPLDPPKINNPKYSVVMKFYKDRSTWEENIQTIHKGCLRKLEFSSNYVLLLGDLNDGTGLEILPWNDNPTYCIVCRE